MFVFSLIISLLLPGILIGLGLFWAKHAPKKVDYVIGYKTTMAQKNDNTWAFAQKYWAKQCLYFGLPLPIPSVLVLFLFRNGNSDTIGNVLIIIVAVQLLAFFLTIIPTERALHKNFEENGKKKR
jgi:hypothetical protein